VCVDHADAADTEPERLAEPPQPLQMNVPCSHPARVEAVEDLLDSFRRCGGQDDVLVRVRRGVATEKIADLDRGLEAAKEVQPLLAELFSRPARGLEQLLAPLFVLDGLRAEVESEEELLGVPEHARTVQLSQQVDALERLGPALGDVPEGDDPIRGRPLDVVERRAKRDRVAVHVREEGDSHAADPMRLVESASMERRPLGGTGVEVSRIVLGCGNFGGIGSAPEFFGQGESEGEAFRIMDAAWELGITSFDTADAYGGGRSETAIGSWIRSRGHRPELTTKTFNPMDAGQDYGLSRVRITRQVESSLDRLGVEQVDLYLAHEFDPETPLEETLATFEGLAEIGLTRTYGVSNFDAEQLRAALSIGRPGVVQNSYSLLERGDEDAVLPLCDEFGLGYTPFSPLAGGWLTGKYKRGEEPPSGSRMEMRPGPYEHLRNDRTFDALDRFAEIATQRGVDTATLAIAWLLAQPRVSAVIIGPRRPEHLAPAVRALDTQLSKAEADELAALFP